MRVVMIGTGVDASLRISNAVVQPAFLTVCRGGHELWFGVRAPQPHALTVGHKEAAVLLHGESIDIEAVMHKLMATLVPQESVKLFPVYVGPIQNLLFEVPQRAFAAQIAIISHNFDWALDTRSVLLP